MTYVKNFLLTLKTHVANLKRDAKDLSRDFQQLEVNSDLKLSILKTVTEKKKRKRDYLDLMRPGSGLVAM